jgi:hypothetical protein
MRKPENAASYLKLLFKTPNTVSNYLSKMNTFRDRLSQTKLICVYDSFCRKIISIITKPVHIDTGRPHTVGHIGMVSQVVCFALLNMFHGNTILSINRTRTTLL